MEPTPYPDVNYALQQLAEGAHAVLGTQLTGIYLYGSLALGDFDPLRSDIDFAAVTEGELSAGQLHALQALHAGFAASPSPWMRQMEGSYIPRQALRRWQPGQRHPHIDRGGVLAVEQHDSDWVIQRFCLRQYGVTICGPPIQDMIDPISSADLIQGVLDLLWWWELQLEENSRLDNPGYRVYAVLSMCRILYTFAHGDIASKPRAARWVLNNLNEKGWPQGWASLIRAALEWQSGQHFDRLPVVRQMIQFTLAASRGLASNPDQAGSRKS
jgi:hypothetical protein